MEDGEIIETKAEISETDKEKIKNGKHKHKKEKSKKEKKRKKHKKDDESGEPSPKKRKKTEDEKTLDDNEVKAKVPVSLEELIEKRKAEEAELNRPKFITKEERAMEALRKRQEEVKQQRLKMNQELSKQIEFLEKAKEDDRYSVPSMFKLTVS
ncbi:hypothetical protein Ciccas_007044 [Cichlidogyrus casuarinus]|uniref:Uncharacterized protein n=1 Tax=Cichlidogyrus casuarinus TaxID=1844966 RepID=A0ABD2Q5A8_9PLAT